MYLPNEAGRTGPMETWPENPKYRVGVGRGGGCDGRAGPATPKLLSLENSNPVSYSSTQRILQSKLKAINGVTRTSGTK